MDNKYILNMCNVTKEFPGVKALDEVSLEVKEGEIHSIVGENGAGKSTLMKVLSGLYPFGSYTGDIYFQGEKVEFQNTRASEEKGIYIIYQELSLVPQMTVLENLLLGNEKHKYGFIDLYKSIQLGNEVLRKVGLDIPLDEKVGRLSIGQQQLVEIAKALTQNVKLLILDEPTAALNQVESDNLLNLLRKFQKNGVTSIYISHKLEEVLDISDSLTVIRDGSSIQRCDVKGNNEINENTIISLMVGREILDRFPWEEHEIGAVVLKVADWVVPNSRNESMNLIDGVSLEIRSGEIVGLGGLMGAGRSEFILSLINAYREKGKGSVWIDSVKVDLGSPRQGILAGLSYLTEDRKGNGLVLGMNIQENLSMAGLEKLASHGLIDDLEEVKVAQEYIQKLGIKAFSAEQMTKNLSGGNQQKVVLGKWLLTEPKVLVLDEPTRGIDVGAKWEMYKIMLDLAKEGVAILMISSELPELLGMSDRILVLNEGKIQANLTRKEATQERIMHFATGGNLNGKSF